MALTMCCETDCCDRISNLPCNVIDCILKYLPLRDVVRTSILSRGWRYKWLSCPHLVFDKDFVKLFNDARGTESVVYHTLLHHKGPVIKFSLENVDFPSFASDRAIDSWLQFLLKHRVEDLNLCLAHQYVISHHFFSFDHLKHLCLQNVVVKVPTTFKGFNRLVSLTLVDVFDNLGELKRFLSKCPGVEDLGVLMHDYTDSLRHLDIDAPNLKYFAFRGGFCSFCIKSASLEEIFIGYVDITSARDVVSKSRGGKSNLIKVFGHLSSIKELSFNGYVLKVLGMDGVLQEPENLIHVTRLELFATEFDEIDVVIGALYLIESSSNIQRLEMSLAYREPGFAREGQDGHTAAAAVQYLKAQQERQVPLNHLQSVEICEFRGSEIEMELVKLLFIRAIALQKLKIKYTDQLPNTGHQVLKTLASFPRASPKAVLIFDD